MNLQFDTDIASQYKSNSQRIRVLTENWVEKNLFCPICGEPILHHYEANRPVADFFCDHCKSDYELKSKESNKGIIGRKIVDGAYETMIERITSLRNPNFFFLTYAHDFVNNFILIPNHFFTPAIIEKRKPLAETARRAGWIGCNINIDDIPESGKIYLVKNNQEIDRKQVLANYQRTESLQTNNLESRGWIMDILNCVDKIQTDDFSLNQVYAFENELKLKHPENNFVRDKIRQQLQYLRDRGFIEFTTRGNYRKIK
jgi:type II restriction enzyme